MALFSKKAAAYNDIPIRQPPPAMAEPIPQPEPAREEPAQDDQYLTLAKGLQQCLDNQGRIYQEMKEQFLNVREQNMRLREILLRILDPPEYEEPEKPKKDSRQIIKEEFDEQEPGIPVRKRRIERYDTPA